ncbi:MAG: bifunctional folylpolyglutamate synthase/dihydrofolate synthase [Pyrinomonadaceae bacterium]|nr:bifunctional folylpolyglutamate synthase/dihydrofolate synthase [Phycisphaerales bacterium]
MPKTSAPAQARTNQTPVATGPSNGPAKSPGAGMTYQAAVKYLHDRVDIERMHAGRVPRDLFKLDRMRAIMNLLGNPHDAVKCIHVAGTKGKGSTCEMTATCLEACGYTVGTYTTPHLIDIRERIRVNRRLIPHAEFAGVAQKIADAAAKLPPEIGTPTSFELTTAMCFQYFADQAVDLAVIECGLGGRLDSTNVITPLVSAITSISLDHTQLLGQTVELIAREKAGIFKPGVPAVTVQHVPSVTAVLREVATDVGTPLQVVGEDIDFSFRHDAGSGRPRHGEKSVPPVTRISLSTRRSSYEHIPVPLKGEHQAQNCGLTLAILDKLTERGMDISETKVMQGLERVQLAGRMEMACESPRILLDGAHNPESIKCLMKAIGSHIGYDSLVVIFGCAADKDVRGILQQLSLGADKAIFTRAAGNARAADPRELTRVYNDICGKGGQSADNFAEALKLAMRAVGRGDLICVTGSFYLVGEAKKLLKELPANK